MAANTKRFTIETSDGISIGCDTREDLIAAVGALRQAAATRPGAEGRTKTGSNGKNGKTSAAVLSGKRDKNGTTRRSGAAKRGASWSATLTRQLRSEMSKNGLELVSAAIEMGDGTTGAALAKRLRKSPGVLGPTLLRLYRDAATVDPGLPKPLELVGRRGIKSLQLDPGFVAAWKETMA